MVSYSSANTITCTCTISIPCVQETGRAGRDGQQSTALLYYNNTDIRANRPDIQKDIINYCRNESKCYRVLMLEHFGYKPDTDQQVISKCCDFCDNSRDKCTHL